MINNKVLFIGSGGIGDAILSLNCAKFVQDVIGKENVDCLMCVRDEVFNVLDYLFDNPIEHQFDNLFNLTQHSDKEKWSNDNWILNNQGELKEYRKIYNEIYYVTPDLLFKSPLRFDYEKYNIHPQIIKQNRLLINSSTEKRKIIYCALNTTTAEYKYYHIRELLNSLAAILPDYLIYFNNITEWAGQKINNGNLDNLPSNVIIKENNDFIDDLEVLKKSSYLITLDNGISHIGYHLGIPRLLLSIRMNLNGVKWLARWYEDVSEVVNYNITIEEICNLVKLNLEIPQTCLIPRNIVLNNLDKDWNKLLYFKY